jgi:3D (Asp-Asp-Asp) domain-containing protein
MGLRQKFKQFKRFSGLILAIVVTNLIAHPLALAAQFDASGLCEYDSRADATAAACGVSLCEYKAPVAKKTAKKADFRAATLRKSAWSPIATNLDLADNEVFHGYHSMTAYTSEAAQTDASPCTTANGFNVCNHGVEDTVAANFLPFGAKVKIPDLFGDRVFIVRDRMNSRYSERVDVWMKEKPDAMKFGVRTARIVVLK